MKLRNRRHWPKRKRKTLDKISRKTASGDLILETSQILQKSSATNPEKKKRGRPRKMPWEWVTGRASNHLLQLREVWTRLETPLLAAQTEEEVTAAFKEHGDPYAQEFVPRLSSDILSLIRHPKFPKRANARIKFLSRSLAGRPSLSFRSSREICERAQIQKNLKSTHRILRHEFYVECSCGYQGPARDNACRNCGAELSFLAGIH